MVSGANRVDIVRKNDPGLIRVEEQKALHTDAALGQAATAEHGHLYRPEDHGPHQMGGVRGGDPVGVVGLNRDPFAQPEERAGRVRRLYVAPSWRRPGVGAALLDAVVGRGRRHFAMLTAFTTSPTAAAFSVARGFDHVHGIERRTVALDLTRPR